MRPLALVPKGPSPHIWYNPRMTLKLNGLFVDCVIGERADERMRLQRLRLDVSLEVDERVADTDELSDTVDYAALSGMLRETLVAAKCKMIERAAKLAAETCLREPRVREAAVEVTKAGSVPGLASASATFRLRKDGAAC